MRLRASLLVFVVLTGLAVLAAYGLGWLPGWFRVTPIPSVAADQPDADVASILSDARAKVVAKPRSADAWGMYGVSLLANGFDRDALACLGEAEARDPRDPRWPYYQGIVLQLVEPSRARECFQRAAERSSALSIARHKFAESLLDAGDFKQAEEWFQSILAKDPSDPRALLGSARAALADGRLEPAEKAALRSLERAPNVKAAHLLLAEIASQRGDEKTSATHLVNARGLPDDQYWPDPFLDEVSSRRAALTFQLIRAENLQSQGKNREAADLLEALNKTHGGDDRVALARGKLLLALGNRTEALDSFRRALQIRPDSIEAELQMAELLEQREDFAAAAECYQRITRNRPTHFQAQLALGNCWEKQRDLAKAADAYRQAVRARPDSAVASRQLGKLLRRMGNEEEGLRNLKAALALDPGDKLTREELDKPAGKPEPE